MACGPQRTRGPMRRTRAPTLPLALAACAATAQPAADGGSQPGDFDNPGKPDAAAPPPRDDPDDDESRQRQPGGDPLDFEFLSDAGEGWLRLIEADWELQPGAEGY